MLVSHVVLTAATTSAISVNTTDKQPYFDTNGLQYAAIKCFWVAAALSQMLSARLGGCSIGGPRAKMLPNPGQQHLPLHTPIQ